MNKDDITPIIAHTLRKSQHMNLDAGGCNRLADEIFANLRTFHIGFHRVPRTTKPFRELMEHPELHDRPEYHDEDDYLDVK